VLWDARATVPSRPCTQGTIPGSPAPPHPLKPGAYRPDDRCADTSASAYAADPTGGWEAVRLTTRGKYFLALVTSLALCTAVGVWMQHHLLCNAMTDIASQRTWTTLAASASDLFDAEPDRQPDALLQHVRYWRAATPTTSPHATWVDDEWRIVATSASPPTDQSAPFAIGTILNWTLANGASEDAGGPVPGTFTTPDGRHLAVACPLPNQPARLLLHRPMSDVAVPAEARQQIRLVGIVTFAWTVVLLTVVAYLAARRYDETLDRERAQATSSVLRQTQTLVRTRDTVIFALAKLADFRDHETGGHLERISEYATILATALRAQPRFAQQITPAFIRLIGLSSVLHDIGKVGIEDTILRKPGPLNPEEWARMKAHTLKADECLAEIRGRMGDSDFLEMAREIAVAHHEHWDGNGYPHGLCGEQIPLAARIVAIADVYDALSMTRVYKPALPHDYCVEVIRSSAGTQFDPDMVATWLTVEKKFAAITARYQTAPAAEPGPNPPSALAATTATEETDRLAATPP